MAEPSLLVLMAGRKPRLRAAPKIRPKEIALHMAVAAMLRKHARPDWRWTHFHALEFKRANELLSDEQEDFQRWCVARGIPHSVAESFDDALAVLSHWGVLRPELARSGGPKGGDS